MTISFGCQMDKHEIDFKYLMPIGHQYYFRAASAQTLTKCLYWLDKYYDINRKFILKNINK